MMRFWRKDRRRFHRRVSLNPLDGDDWITVPFRLAETARVSIYTIARQPDVPPHVRQWIAQWLEAYNSHLIYHMKQNYGPDIFPLLDRITLDVMPGDNDDQSSTAVPVGDTDSWEKWEGQFREEGN